MQVRSANSSVCGVGSVRNPMIIAFDRNWREIYRKPLHAIEGMAYGVRDDYESGYRGIKLNWAGAVDGVKVYAWATPSI